MFSNAGNVTVAKEREGEAREIRLSTRQEKSTQEMGKEGNTKKKISEGAGGNVVETIQVLYCTPLSTHCLFRC